MFTRKHFQTVADVVKTIDNETTRKSTCQRFIVVFRESNPKFNEELFKKACNVK